MIDLFHSFGPVKINLFFSDRTVSFIMNLIFSLVFIAAGLKGIADILRRKKEIEKLISGGKYLIGHLDSIGTPEPMSGAGDLKNARFSCIDETGKRYCVQSEPFHSGKIPFDKETAVKIYVDSLTLPKITYVSAEYIMSAESDTDDRTSDL